jgi:hypothetical protein
MREVTWDAPIEEGADVFQRVRGLGLRLDAVDHGQDVTVRDLVDRLRPREMPMQRSADLVLGPGLPPLLRQELVQGRRESRSGHWMVRTAKSNERLPACICEAHVRIEAESDLGPIGSFEDEPGPTGLADTDAERRRAVVEIDARFETADGQIGEVNFWHGLARISCG